MRLIDADELKLKIVEEGQQSKRYKIGDFWELNRDEIWKVIDDLPTIEERKTGKWMRTHDGHYLCDHCGEQCADEIMGEPRDRYCKWCGADMRGEQI